MSDEREPYERHLVTAYDEGRIAATWNRIAGARQRIPRGKRTWVVVVAIAAVVAYVAWPRTKHERPLASRDPAISTAPGTVLTRSVTLDDSSTIGLDAGSRLEVLTNEATRFSTLLETGTAHFDVHPGGPRRWEIETALASVEVVGTAFTVQLDAHRLEVRVERGVVMVHGERVPGRVVRLTAGQHIVVGSEVVASAPPVPHEPPAPPAPPVAPPPSVVAPPVAAPPVAAPPVAASPAPSRVAPAHAEESVASVVAEADRLSAAGDPVAAAKLLERVRARDGDRASGLVSFTLGRLYLDALGKPELAAIAFADVIARANPRSLIEDAYARRVEALLRADLRDRAAEALDAYARAYPHGRRLEALRALVGQR
jgi:hypothetical protein